MKTLNCFITLLVCITALTSFGAEEIVSPRSPILIITHSYNRPDFIEIQDKTFKALLEDAYEFVVFNDARNLHIRQQIKDTCQKLNLRCIEIPQEIHDRPYLYRMNYEDFNHSCCRCANVVQYSLDVLGFDYPGIVAIVDSDMFLIKKFSIKKYLDGFDMAGCPQSRGNGKIHYIWNGIVFMNMDTLPNKKTMNWNCGRVEGEPADVGGYLHYYLKNNTGLRVKYFGTLHSDSFPKDIISLKEAGFDDIIIDYLITKNTHNIEFFIDKHFLHYRGGTNWDAKSSKYHQEKSKNLNDFINKIIEENR